MEETEISSSGENNFETTDETEISYSENNFETDDTGLTEEMDMVEDMAEENRTVEEDLDSTPVVLRDVIFVNREKGWAVGDDGKILYTIDGGNVWGKMDWDGVSSFTSISFADEKNGWIAGGGGTIIHTGNGGESWELQESGTGADLNSIVFYDNACGWAAGSYGTIIHTTDGGYTWTEQTSSTGSYLWDITFVSDQKGWASGEEGTLISTEDGGNTWGGQDTGRETPITAIQFIDDTTGWALASGQGRFDTGQYLYRTTDGGYTWQSSDEIQLTVNGMYFTQSGQGWLVCWDGAILHTADGGATLQGQPNPINEYTQAVYFLDNNYGWAVGGRTGVREFIIHTTDGGNTWEIQRCLGDTNG